MSEAPYLSIVIPAYNEERRLPGNLAALLQFLDGQPYSSEVVLVDDGSADRTAAIVREASGRDPRVRPIVNDHRGKAYAVRTGMLAARGRYVLFTDADLPTPLSELAKMLPLLEGGQYDIAIGSREGLGARRLAEPWYRHAMGRVFNALVRLLAVGGFQDTQCGFKLFTGGAARDLFARLQLYGERSGTVKGSALTGFDVEVLFLAVRSGYRVKEQPVEWHYGEQSKVSPLRESVRMFLDVVRVRMNDWRGRYRQAVAAKGRMGGLPPSK